MSAQHSFPEKKIGVNANGGDGVVDAHVVDGAGATLASASTGGGIEGVPSGRNTNHGGRSAAAPTAGEFAGRVALSAGLIALVFAVWMVNLQAAAGWTGLYARMAPRLSVFGMGLFTALAIQGCRVKARTLLVCAGLALAGMFALQGWANLFEVVKPSAETLAMSGGKPRDWASAGGNVYLHARPDMLGPGPALLLMRLECALFAAVFLGTWIGQGAWRAWHFVTLLMFAGVFDAWLNWQHIPESVDAASPLAVLRMPFVPALGRMTLAPAFTDIMFISAAFEASRVFRMHVFWLALGALTGYCSGGFFGPAPFLSMPLVAIGMIVAAWPDMKLDENSVGKAFLALALMILMLAGVRLLRIELNAPREQNAAPPELRNAA
ncbi:MAG TPA: hypothetical protein VKX17_13010 [Planctomycetota bacterium]|nr:hypothetical protein [Planctomycetota bacterium]